MSSIRSGHPHDRQYLTVPERQIYALLPRVSMPPVQRDSRQRRAHLEAREACRPRSFFAQSENVAADSLSRPVWMDKEGPNSRGICAWVEHRIVTPWPMIAPVRCLSPRPSTAGRKRCRIGHRLNGIVRPVRDQLRVQAEPCTQRALNLGSRVFLGPKSSNGRVNQCGQARDIRRNSETEAQMIEMTRHRTIEPF